MKKFLLIMLIATMPIITPPAHAIPLFSSVQMAQHHIDDLTFKDIMRAFYNGQMRNTLVGDEDIEKLPHVGLGDNSLAVMHPIVKYTGNDGQSRYLVIIEKVHVNAEGWIDGCHACVATADLYTFKPAVTGGYQLVSRSIDDEQFGGSWGRTALDTEQIEGNIQPLGNNLLGSIIKDGFSSTGTTEEHWSALHLPEDNYIGLYAVADAGGDNRAGLESKDSPLAYSYESTTEVMANGSNYYPIRVTYTGDMPDDDGKIIKANGSKVVNFDPIKKTYR